MKSKYEQFYQSVELKEDITLKNRIVMSPMHTWSSDEDGTISEAEAAYYARRANGVGLVITGCVPVQENGVGFTSQMAAYDDKYIPSLKKLAQAVKSGGAPAILQIFHAGNKALPDLVPNGEVVSSSDVKIEASTFAPALTPRALTDQEINDAIQAFGDTVRRAIEAGFDGIEIHGAHGFLIQNFLSPYFNQRQDKWGGSLENRLRFAHEVVRTIKNTIKEYAQKPFILGYRISPDEPQDGGLRMADTYALIDLLVAEKVDYIHASLMDALNAKPVDSKDEQTYLDLLIKYVDGRVPMIAAGCMAGPESIAKALDKGLTMAAIGHALVINPDFVEKISDGEEDGIETVLKKSKIKALDIPEKLWNQIEASGNWFQIEK